MSSLQPNTVNPERLLVQILTWMDEARSAVAKIVEADRLLDQVCPEFDVGFNASTFIESAELFEDEFKACNDQLLRLERASQRGAA